MTPTSQHIDYIPPLHINRLTVFYDLFMRLLMRDARIKAKLIDDASIEDGQGILDLGCGTGTLLLMTKRRYPRTHVVGLDIDQKILLISLRKSRKETLPVELTRGSAAALPFNSELFDRVFCSLVFHHLNRDQKIQSLYEILRVLKPGGRFILSDFGKPHNFMMSLMSFVMRRIEDISDNLNGLLPVMMKQSGFIEVDELDRFSSPFGTITFYSGKKRGTEISLKS